MGKKEIGLKMFLLPLMLAIVLTEATGSQGASDPEMNLPSIIFRKEHGIPANGQEATVQNNFCAAFPFADGTFLTSAHCLATAPSIDLVGLGNVYLEKIVTHPVFDLAAFQLKNQNLIPASWHVGVNSKIVEDTCSVMVLNEAFRWTALQGATLTHCLDNALENKICFTSEKIPTGLDFAVVCDLGRTLHAVFHSQRGLEISFTVCSPAYFSEIIKQDAMTRVKRQAEDTVALPADDAGAPPANDPAAPPANDPAAPPANDPAASPADDSAAPPADDSAAPPADSAVVPVNDTAVPPANIGTPPVDTGAPPGISSAPGTSTDTGDFLLPPPKQLFPKMPANFPFPNIETIQSQPVPTKSHKRPVIQNQYPVQAPAEKQIPELAPINVKPTPQIKEQQIVAKGGDVVVQLPMRTEAPHTSDLTEYEVLGAHDSPVLLANNEVKKMEASAETHHIAATQHVTASDDQYTIPAGLEHRAQRPGSGGFATAPADWRYSVTPRPHRKCKTTTSRPSCRALQPSPAEAVAYKYHGQMAAGSPAMDASVHSSRENYQPNQAMAAAAAGTLGAVGASRPIGPDPWMVAAHEAVPTGFVKPKEDEKEPEGTPVESAAESNTLAAISIVLANTLYFLL